MKRRVSVAGLVPVVAVALTMAACSHNKTQEKSNEQAGQSKQGQQASTSASQNQMSQGQTAEAQQQNQQMLGEQNVSAGTAQIQRQKKVVSTVIVKEKIPTVKESTIRADINRMDAKQFAAIGFPRDVAQNIVQYRDRNGPFHNVNDLSNVDGVSRSMLDRFDGSLGVDQAQAGISGQSQGQSQSQGQGMTGMQQQSDHSQTEQYQANEPQSSDSQAGQQGGQQSDSSSTWNQ